jgi:hypothetical protein
MHDIEVHARVSHEFAHSLQAAVRDDRRTVHHVEPPTANEVNRLRTERFENRRAIKARVGFQSFPLPRDISAKVRRFASRKAIHNQSLTSSVLNPRSRELWRQTAGETD